MRYQLGTKTVMVDQPFGISEAGHLFVPSLPAGVEGQNYSASFLRNSTPEERSSLGFVSVEDPPQQSFDPQFYFDFGSPRSIESIRDMLKQRVAAKRYSVETGGLIFAGQRIMTDDRSQAKILAVRVRAMTDAAYTVNWKTAEGFVTLNAAQIISMSDAVAAHVQACFDAEMDHASAIDELSSVAEAELYDINSGWPV